MTMDCPQVGTGGAHSREYYGEGWGEQVCQWCGAVAPEEEEPK